MGKPEFKKPKVGVFIRVLDKNTWILYECLLRECIRWVHRNPAGCIEAQVPTVMCLNSKYTKGFFIFVLAFPHHSPSKNIQFRCFIPLIP